jgi:molybdopterin-containing oxidoreductase family membrane subunit
MGPDQTYASIEDTIDKPPLTPVTRTWLWWLGGFGLATLLLLLYLAVAIVIIIIGIGIWGTTIPAAWAFAILNFVWWIGIAHAGTLISAILLLTRQRWRTSINRFAEAMAVFAISVAGLYPIMHLGRPWVFYWLVPYPDTTGVWPQFRSPLEWDFFAVTTYVFISATFWFVGLIPDFASLRDRAVNPLFRALYGALSLGWRGAAKHWQRYQRAYLLLAAIATPLVVSVESIISLDFGIGIIPGWNSLMPPYVVIGAIYSGFAMVLLIAIPLRKAFRLENLITLKHFNNIGKMILVLGLLTDYSYMSEIFTAWYGGDPSDLSTLHFQMFGPYAWIFWTMIFCNLVMIQLLWFKRVRTSQPALMLIAFFALLGIWMDNFHYIIEPLTHDFLPSAWHIYTPTIYDYAFYAGSFGIFLTLVYLFIRFIPTIASSESKELLHQLKHEEPSGGAQEVKA